MLHCNIDTGVVRKEEHERALIVAHRADVLNSVGHADASRTASRSCVNEWHASATYGRW